jgi:excisionase family DNA binding protein
MARDHQADWLTSKEAAALLRVHPKHIYRLLQRGLPAHRVGGQWRFTSAELQAWARRGAGDARREPRAEGNHPPHLSTAVATGACLVATAGDLAIEALLAEVNRQSPPALGPVHGDPLAAAALLESGAVLAVAVLGEAAALPSVRVARLHVAHEEFGLAAAPGATVPALPSLARGTVRLASWSQATDLRRAFDAVLGRAGLDPTRVHRSAGFHATQVDVVMALLRGEAVAAVTTAAWARRAGLPFVALGSIPLGLVVTVPSLASPGLIRCWEVLQSASFREALQQAGGYDLAGTGAIRYLPAAGLPDGEGRPPPAPEAAPASDDAVRLAVLLRPGGADAGGVLGHLAADLTRLGLRVAGFVRVPRRGRGGVQGYDLKRLGRPGRVPLARREAASGGSSYARFAFRAGAFRTAAGWLKSDGAHADVLVIDGAGALEAGGGGHLATLVWACRRVGRTAVVLCVREDHLPTILQRLGRTMAGVLRLSLADGQDDRARGAFAGRIQQALAPG